MWKSPFELIIGLNIPRAKQRKYIQHISIIYIITKHRYFFSVSIHFFINSLSLSVYTCKQGPAQYKRAPDPKHGSAHVEDPHFNPSVCCRRASPHLISTPEAGCAAPGEDGARTHLNGVYTCSLPCLWTCSLMDSAISNSLRHTLLERGWRIKGEGEESWGVWLSLGFFSLCPSCCFPSLFPSQQSHCNRDFVPEPPIYSQGPLCLSVVCVCVCLCVSLRACACLHLCPVCTVSDCLCVFYCIFHYFASGIISNCAFILK